MSEPLNEKEAALIHWMDQDSRRREIRRLRHRLRQLEIVQLMSYFFIFFWVCAMFTGYQLRPDLVPASVAGLITAMTLFGGAVIIWRLLHLKRLTERRIEAEAEGLDEDEAPSLTTHED